MLGAQINFKVLILNSCNFKFLTHLVHCRINHAIMIYLPMHCHCIAARITVVVILVIGYLWIAIMALVWKRDSKFCKNMSLNHLRGQNLNGLSVNHLYFHALCRKIWPNNRSESPMANPVFITSPCRHLTVDVSKILQRKTFLETHHPSDFRLVPLDLFTTTENVPS